MSSRVPASQNEASALDQGDVASEHAHLGFERRPVGFHEGPGAALPSGCRRTAQGRGRCPVSGLPARARCSARSRTAGSRKSEGRQGTAIVRPAIPPVPRQPASGRTAQCRRARRRSTQCWAPAWDRARALPPASGRAPLAPGRRCPHRCRSCRALPTTTARSARRSSGSRRSASIADSSKIGRSMRAHERLESRAASRRSSGSRRMKARRSTTSESTPLDDSRLKPAASAR